MGSGIFRLIALVYNDVILAFFQLLSVKIYFKAIGQGRSIADIAAIRLKHERALSILDIALKQSCKTGRVLHLRKLQLQIFQIRLLDRQLVAAQGRLPEISAVVCLPRHNADNIVRFVAYLQICVIPARGNLTLCRGIIGKYVICCCRHIPGLCKQGCCAIFLYEIPFELHPPDLAVIRLQGKREGNFPLTLGG